MDTAGREFIPAVGEINLLASLHHSFWIGPVKTKGHAGVDFASGLPGIEGLIGPTIEQSPNRASRSPKREVRQASCCTHCEINCIQYENDLQSNIFARPSQEQLGEPGYISESFYTPEPSGGGCVKDTTSGPSTVWISSTGEIRPTTQVVGPIRYDRAAPFLSNRRSAKLSHSLSFGYQMHLRHLSAKAVGREKFRSLHKRYGAR